MYTPSQSEFIELADEGNLVPVYREVVADGETPVSAMAKLGCEAPAFLLESVEGGERLGRYSFLGKGARRIVKLQNEPLDKLRALMERYEPVALPGLPRFFGGAVGYVGYDIVRFHEELGASPPDQLDVPDAIFMLTETVVVFDHVTRSLKVVATVETEGTDDLGAAYAEAVERIESTLKVLEEAPAERLSILRAHSDSVVGGRGEGGADAHAPKERATVAAPESSRDRAAFEAGVQKAKAYIEAGDIFQVVLSQRFEAPVHASPFEVYRWLRVINPSPYLFYLAFDELCLVGSSPEVMVRLEDGEALLRPIAGTRPRGATPDADEQLERDLLADEKERAEHVMLVDLGRNDLGRVSQFGSVRPESVMRVERYSHVMHMVSDVRSRLVDGEDAFSLLRATFPAGTLSGAPKVRAMEIIDEIEPVRRGPYGGAVGYIGYSGNMDTCIAIRTLVMKDGKAYLQAGAGIVADSDPASEYMESLHKAQALFRAVALAEESEARVRASEHRAGATPEVRTGGGDAA